MHLFKHFQNLQSYKQPMVATEKKERQKQVKETGSILRAEALRSWSVLLFDDVLFSSQ